MISDVLELLNNWQGITAAAVAIFALLLKSLQMLGTVMDFRDKHFVEKRYQRLRELRSHTTERELANYLDGAIKLEAFQIASGVRASAKKMEAIAKIANLGIWTSTQIRQFANFLVIAPDDPLPRIKIEFSDKFSAYLSLFFGGFMIIAGGVFNLAFLLEQKPASFFVGFGMQCMLTVCGVIISGSFAKYKGAVRVQDYLMAHPEFFASSGKAHVETPPVLPEA
jgi:hypothetical protein